MKTLAIPKTLSDLLDARNNAINLHDQAQKLVDLTAKTLAEVGVSLPADCRIKVPHDTATRKIDIEFWRKAFDITGLAQLMDSQACDEFERSLRDDRVPFTESAIRETFIRQIADSEMMFRRGIVNVFRFLSDDYKTNSNEPFRVGSKIVISFAVEPSYAGGLKIRHGSGENKINDIDRVFRTLNGEKFKEYDLRNKLNIAFQRREVYADGFYKARAFKNGNMHMEFMRDDLLEKVNDQIAIWYGENKLGGKK